MTIDSKLHVIEPQHGFAVDKETGHIVGLMQAPEKKSEGDHEFPAWVIPHASHVVRKQVEGAADHISTPGFAEFHVNRGDGVVTVLVKDAEEEAKALSPREEPKAADANDPDGKPATGGTPTADLPT